MIKMGKRGTTTDKGIQNVSRNIFHHENAVLGIVLAALIVIMGIITKGATVGRANVTNIALQSAIRGVVSVGQSFVILSAGIDVSVGGIGLFSSILGASLMTSSFMNILGRPIPLLAALPIMVVVGIGWGSINGSLVSRLGMPPLIVTLGMWEITKGMAFQVGGGQSIGFLPDSLLFFGSGKIAGVPVPVVIFIIIAVIGYFILNYTSYGRSVYAVGGNPVSAWLSGINVDNVLFSVYAISGFLAGIASVIITGRVMSASMITLEGLELDTIAATTVGGVSLAGGKGSLIGVILGVFIIGVINNAMSVMGANPSVQGTVKGLIIIIAVAVDHIRRRRNG